MIDRLFARGLLLAAIAAFFLMPVAMAWAETGEASVYGNEHGQWRRADGKRFIPSEIVCAHRTRKLGSVPRVTNLANGRSILCPIRDRGPAAWTHRVLDLSFGAARALGVRGLARVRID